MSKHSEITKDSSTSRPSTHAGRSMVKPILALLVLVAAALSAAFLLVKHGGSQNQVTPGNSSQDLNSKPVITNEGWVKGNPAAKTVLVEFGDFQCPSCAMARLKVNSVLSKFEGNLKVVFKQYPMESIHRNSMIAAQASEAAGRQQRFWEMYEILFARQSEWASVPDALTFFLKYAAELNLDVERFRQDLLDGEIRNRIFRQVLEGQVAQVRSVPTFFLNGKMLQPIKSDAELEEWIAQAIRVAQ